MNMGHGMVKVRFGALVRGLVFPEVTTDCLRVHCICLACNGKPDSDSERNAVDKMLISRLRVGSIANPALTRQMYSVLLWSTLREEQVMGIYCVSRTHVCIGPVTCPHGRTLPATTGIEKWRRCSVRSAGRWGGLWEVNLHN